MHRILVVEDNAINRELICDWLGAHGYAVVSAEDVGGAQRLLEDQKPDAVLLDVQLSSEDGLSLATWMRRQPGFSGIPVIAVTAHAMVTEQQRFLQTGCNACISFQSALWGTRQMAVPRPEIFFPRLILSTSAS